MADLKLEEIIGIDPKFDPTTPLGGWDSITMEHDNTTDILVFNYEAMTPAYAYYHTFLNGSPSPISGDTIARFKDKHSGNPRLESHRLPTGYAEPAVAAAFL
jgi:hypothetical protein